MAKTDFAPTVPAASAPVVVPPAFESIAPDRVVAMKGQREFAVQIDGKRYEHVAEDAEGRWIYQRS